jgi:hypothetical protein
VGYDYHVVLGSAATAIGIAGYIPYYRDIFRGTTKPHPFSWFLWALLAGIAFTAQAVKGAGPGAWASGISAVANFGICLASLVHGERSIKGMDWLYLIAALAGLLSWLAAGDPLLAILLVTATNSLAFGPTFRKSWDKPGEETANTYLLSAVKWALSCTALESLSITTALFPFSSFVLNAALTILLLKGRKRPVRAPAA